MKYWTRWFIMTALCAMNNVAEGQFVMRPDDHKSGIPRSWITSNRKDGKPETPPPKPPTFKEVVDSIPPVPPVATSREEPILLLTPPPVNFQVVPPLTPEFSEQVKRNWIVPLIIGVVVVGTMSLIGSGDWFGTTVEPLTPVPEPSSFWLLAFGIIILTWYMRRAKFKS